jgi:acyl-CoA thioester hydrolase
MQPVITWDYPEPFTLMLAPETGDIDGLEHTNNAVYVRWCEQVGWAHSAALGLNLDDYRRLNRGMAIRHGAYDYVLPTNLGERLLLGTWLLAGDSPLTMRRRFRLVRVLDGKTVLRAQWELVCIELSSGRAKRMPPEFCDIYLPAIVADLSA